MNSAADATLVIETAAQMRPFLAGKPPQVQSAILAELLAMWIVGHSHGNRQTVLGMHMRLVLDLVDLMAQRGEGNRS